jgi:hypothetical protein
MFGLRIDQAKGLFFDRPAVVSAVDRAGRRILSKFGAFVRQRAQSIMLGHKAGRIGAKSKVTNRAGTSAPGDPPTPHLGLLVKFLFFAYEPARRSVIIGPAKIGGKIGNAPQALEEGGASQTLIMRKGQRTLVNSVVRQHPYMKPSLDHELPKLPGMWKDTVKP